MTLRSLQWRYGVLLVLRWLPIGFVAPLLVLILLSRDLSLAEVGPVMGGYSLVTLLAEIPTGGLADAHGRRRVLVASSLLQAVFLVGILTLDGVVWMTLAAMVGGASRALDSGPLEAWFVDACKTVDADADIERRLARGNAIDAVTLAVGAIAGGLIGSAAGSDLDVVVMVALGTQLVHAAAAAALMDDSVASGQAQPASARAAVREAARVVRSAQGMQWILVAGFGVGVALTSVEILFQPRFDDLLTGDAAPALLGVILAASFAGAAVGSELGPRVRRWRRWSPQWFLAGAGLTQAVCFLLMSAATTAWLTAIGILALYIVLGAVHPVESTMVHERVDAAARTTVVSARSATMQTGGLVGSLALPVIAAGSSIPLAWVVAAVVVAGSGLLYLGVPAVSSRAEAGQREPEESSSLG